MKTKPVTVERILQISNDISEDMCNATKAELIEVVKYFRAEVDKEVQAKNQLRGQATIAAMEGMNKMLKVLAQ